MVCCVNGANTHGESTGLSDMLPSPLAMADFFAGIGLHRYAFEPYGWVTKYANDIDEAKRAMYTTHFADADDHYHVEDVNTVDVAEVPSVTLATASFPCNDLSLAGARKGLAGEQSSAYWGFVRVLEQLGSRRPPVVLLENVVGFLTSYQGSDFRAALVALNSLGYAVDAFIVDAVHFVPQSRRRIFVVGTLGAEPSRIPTSSICTESVVRPRRLVDVMEKNSDLRWHVRPLPDPPKRSRDLSDIIEDLPDDASEWWSQERVDYLVNQMSAKHYATADLMLRGERVSYGTVFRRMRKGRSMAELRTDGVAGCLRTPRGGSGRQILLRAGGGKRAVRLLTPRECARLMGADDYRIEASPTQALFGFGDAVCVPVMQWIARHHLYPSLRELTSDTPFAPNTIGSSDHAAA